MTKENIIVIENLEKSSWKMILAGILLFVYIFMTAFFYIINLFKLSLSIPLLLFVIGVIYIFCNMIDKAAPDNMILSPTDVKFIFSNDLTESCRIREISLIRQKRHKSERYIIEKINGGRLSYLLDRKQGKALVDWFEDTISIENRTTHRK